MEKYEPIEDEWAIQHPRTANVIGCIGVVIIASVVKVIEFNQRILDTKDKIKQLLPNKDEESKRHDSP